MISRHFIIAIFIMAGTPAIAQTGPDCPPRCGTEAPSTTLDDRLNLDTGSAIRKQNLDRAMQENTAEGPVSSGGGIIPFVAGTSNLGKGARAKLDPMIAWLKAHPERKARLDGHADDPGTDEYNLALGDKRANSVLAYMVAHGIESSRLSTITFGRSRPHSPDAKQNGRVEVILGQ
jgi:peptidoglycan-associated lipoprotein